MRSPVTPNILPKSSDNNSHFINACDYNVKQFKPKPKVKPIQGKNLTVLSCNIRGWQSKQESLSNIARARKADIIMLTETHCSGDKAPKIKGYTTYHRNRTSRSKGGLAILVFDSISKFVTKLESSIEPSEFFSIRLDCFDPHLIVMNHYGIIEGQYTNIEILKIQAQLFNTFENHAESGAVVLLAGDFNNHIANLMGMSQNSNNKLSAGGKNLASWVNDKGLHLLNQMDQSHTHFDRSSKNKESNILDLAIMNEKHWVKKFEVDKQLEATPYRIRKVKGGRKRFYTDHTSIFIELAPNWSKKPITNKITNWNYSKKGGDDAFADLTDRFSDEFSRKIREEKDIDALYEWYIIQMDKLKMEAYGKTTSTISKAKKVDDSKMWHNRLKEVSKSIDTLGKHKINDKVWELRNKISNKYSDKQFVSVKDPHTGALTQDRQSTYNTILDYNFDLLRKDKIVKDAELEKLDAESDLLIECGKELLEDEDEKSITYEEFEEVLTKVKLANKAVYRDLVKAGDWFKRAYFEMINRMYSKEEMPLCFADTVLMKLFKNKGSRNDLKMNRFIHLKDYTPKILERCIMVKLEKKMSHATPNFQIGGQKMCSTTEH